MSRRWNNCLPNNWNNNQPHIRKFHFPSIWKKGKDKPLLIKSHADDTTIYDSCHPSDLPPKTEDLTCLLNALSSWSTDSHLEPTPPRPRPWFCPQARYLVFTPLDNSFRPWGYPVDHLSVSIYPSSSGFISQWTFILGRLHVHKLSKVLLQCAWHFTEN